MLWICQAHSSRYTFSKILIFTCKLYQWQQKLISIFLEVKANLLLMKMSVKYPSLITIVFPLVVLSSENSVHKKAASLVHNSNNGASGFSWENHQPPACSRDDLYVLPTLSQKVLKRHAFQDQDLLKSVICTVSSRILWTNHNEECNDYLYSSIPLPLLGLGHQQIITH